MLGLLFSLLFTLGFGFSFNSLKRSSQNALFAEEGASLSTCPVTATSLFQSQNLCTGAAKTACQVCAPSSVTVQPGGSATFTISLSGCTWSGWSTSQHWSTPFGVSASVTTASDGSSTTWVVTAQSNAIVGSTGQVTAEWCLGSPANGYAGSTAQIVVGGSSTPTPAPTNTPTQQCPAGYTMAPSFSHTPSQAGWCSGISPCSICKSLGSWKNGVRTVNLTLACPVSTSVTAFRSWSLPFNTDVSRTWWPQNAGTTWTLTILGSGQGPNAQFNLTNEWCLTDPGTQGYVSANALIPLS